MKKISYSLIMITLFGTFFPSYQAHAEGKKYIEFKNFENTASFNEDLINKLANSKTFEAYYYHMFTLAMFSSMSLSTKSEKDLKQISSKLEDIVEKKDINANVYDVIGLQADNVYTEKISKLQIKLQNEFPELVLMDEIQRSEIVNNAIVRGNLEAKALAVADRDSCFKDATEGHNGCLANGKWWRGATAFAGGICVLAVVACLAAGTIVTVGTGAAAFAAGLLPFATGCATAFFAAFNFTSSGSSECDSTFTVRSASCVEQYGKLVEGGGI